MSLLPPSLLDAICVAGACTAQCGIDELPTRELWFGMRPEEIPEAEQVIISVIPENRRKASDSTWLHPMSGNLAVNGDTIKLRTINVFYEHEPFPLFSNGSVATRYVWRPSGAADCFVTFDFYRGRLFQVGIFGKGMSTIRRLDLFLDKAYRSDRRAALSNFFRGSPDHMVREPLKLVHLGLDDSIGKNGALFYHFKKATWSDEFVLWLEDPKARLEQPGWCGNDRRRVSWDGFARCLERLDKRQHRKTHQLTAP